MEYSPQDITTATFAIVKKGYDPAEVRAYLNGVSKTLESSQQQATAMEARARAAVAKLQELTQAEQTAAEPAAGAAVAAPPAPSSDDSEAIGRALLVAQRTADSLIAEARTEADTMVSAARAEAGTLVADAQRQAEVAIEEGRAEGRRALEGERAKAESDVQALLARREFLLADVEQLEGFVATHRARLLELSGSLRETAEADLGELRRPLLSAAADAPVAPAVTSAPEHDEPAGGAGDDLATDGAGTASDEDEADGAAGGDEPTQQMSSLAGLVDDVDAPADPEPTPTGNPNLLDFGA